MDHWVLIAHLLTGGNVGQEFDTMEECARVRQEIAEDTASHAVYGGAVCIPGAWGSLVEYAPMDPGEVEEFASSEGGAR